MEVREAEAFLMVADELHFGRAAARLNMAQPPLSRLIRQLERKLRTRLFDRSTRSVEMTPAGSALVDPARRLVAVSREAQEAVSSAMNGETGTVHIGFAGASINRTIGQLARTLRRTHPRVLLEFHGSQFSPAGLDRVLDGTLDLAFGRWDFIPATLESHVIALETTLVVLPARHPLADQPEVRVSDLAHENWITLPGGFGSALYNRLTTLTRGAGFVPKITQTAPDSWTLVILVAAEMGCALTLDSVRDNVTTPGVVFRPVADPQEPLEVRMIWRRDDPSIALRNVTEAAKALLPDPRIQESS
ncbi:MAG: LysR family transcriptional regulator [Nesterenkonia sp.]|uniref:LysR family transcriptional regulator n=1 Tax=Nesterenkonia marinintestina TaxID=2979865 RepID=UPI0021BFA9A7|nr:LysR family transcriptional regulator [Nesterenkonia sp. GX14115]MDO5492981.1 LysR family transcriptional regulator [Nesterenkonia sp.]